ncbi:MAG: PAS domain-containing protein [Flavobacterium sp.]|nr:PAS domain-containing protein [Flavobacterium sp.]
MASINNTLDQRTFKKLSRLYIIALSAIALTVIVSQILIRKHLNDQQSDSTVINVAGRQRMLSQKLTKEILLLTTVSDEKNRIILKDQLKKTLSLWELSHVSLQKGNDSLGLPKKNSKTVTTLFSQLNPIFTTIENATKNIIQKVETNSLLPIQDIQVEVEKVENNESQFLTLMDKIVNQYDAEANEKVSWLRNLEMILMALTLLLLLGELVFVFWPTAKTVKKSISELLEAEKKAKKMAYDADILSLDKINSTKELRALNHAMDETLLFARITSNGNIVHIGNKFSRLFKYTNFSSNANFVEVISIHENEQAIFENIIANYKKTGWQGEVKATTNDNIDIWLEMAIIPFNPTDDKSELLIIASDISKRKKAQLEIERLTQLNFEEKNYPTKKLYCGDTYIKYVEHILCVICVMTFYLLSERASSSVSPQTPVFLCPVPKSVVSVSERRNQYFRPSRFSFQ